MFISVASAKAFDKVLNPVLNFLLGFGEVLVYLRRFASLQ